MTACIRRRASWPASLPPDGTPQPVVFHPAQQHRVVSPMTAAQMKKMMEGVVLFGTARRAILNGYTVAGKTGTAQKVDPATGAYSKTKYVASFIGFCAGQQSGDNHRGDSRFADRTAPGRPGVARRSSSASPSRCWSTCTCRTMWTSRTRSGRTCARRRKTTMQADESSDRLGAPSADGRGGRQRHRKAAGKFAGNSGGLEAVGWHGCRASFHQLRPASAASAVPPGREMAQAAPPSQPPSSGASRLRRPGTVVLDVDSGVVVPSFLGKPLRSAVETAQQSGVEINAIGSGVARQQWPAAGSHLPSGQKITVRFTH